MNDDLNDAKEYVNTVSRMAMVLPLETAQRLVREIERTDAVLPIVDPTAYLRLRKTLPEHQAQVRAFLDFRAALERLANGAKT